MDEPYVGCCAGARFLLQDVGLAQPLGTPSWNSKHAPDHGQRDNHQHAEDRATTNAIHERTMISSLSAPRLTILKVSSGSGRCRAFAPPQGPRIQTSRCSSVVRITGIAFGCMGATIAFGDVVR